MTRVIRQARSELEFLLYSRYLVLLTAILGAAVALAFVGSFTHARSAHATFVDEVAEYEARGITLADALSQPVAVTRADGQETIDNPLKYDFLEVGKSVHAIQGTAMISTALEFVTFLIVPLLFLAIGSYAANVDRRNRTVLLRGSRERWTWVVAGKLVALAVLCAATPIVVAGMGALAGLVGSGMAKRLTTEIGYPLVAPTAQGTGWWQLATTAAVCLFFGIVGYAIGYLTRSNSWPLVLAAAALFMLPFVSAWDPRNLLAVVGSQAYEFWGQFRLRLPLEVSTRTAIAVLLGYLGLALAVVAVSTRSVPKA